MNEVLQQIQQYWQLLLPILLLQWGLALFAVVHVWRHPHYKAGSRAMWLCIVLFVQTIGPILYFVIGRGEAPPEE